MSFKRRCVWLKSNWKRPRFGRRFAESAETRVFVDGEEVHRSKARDGVIDAEFEEVPDEPPRKLPR